MKGNVLSKLKQSSIQYKFIKSMNLYSLILSFDHWHYATGGVNQDCWVLEYPWQLAKNKDWSGGVMECWA
jgi:hypothetical protein